MAQRTIINKQASNIKQMFDDIAPDYDRLNRLISVGWDKVWRRRAVTQLSRALPSRVLDLAAGTGDFSIALAQAIPGVEVTAADLSANMLAEAARKSQELGLQQITTVECNALEMPFSDACFDAVSCTFGVRNFSDLLAGYQEMRRVLRPGGMVCVLELCEPKRPVAKWFYRQHAFRVIPMLGSLVGHHRSAYSYLPESIRQMTQREQMLDVMQRAGFERTHYTVFFPGVCALYVGYVPQE